MSRLFIISLLALCGVIVSIDAQDTLPQSPPVLLLSDDMVITWTPEDGFTDLAPLPTYLDPNNRRLRVWTSPRYHPASGSFFYVGVSELWRENLNAGIYAAAPGAARNIYRVDVYTGEVKTFAGQRNAQEDPIIHRTSARVIPDSGRVVWAEEHATTEILIADILTGEILSQTTLDISFGLLSSVIDNHIIVSYREENGGGYAILDDDGVIQYESAEPFRDNTHNYTYLYDDDGTLYFGGTTARISLVDFTFSETPGGVLVQYAVDAPESSMRLAAPQSDSDGRCMTNLYTPSGEVVHAVHVYHFGLSPDGREMVYYDWDSENANVTRRYLTHIVLNDDDTPEITTHDIPAGFIVIGIHWGNTRTVLQRSDDDFRGNFFCGAG